MKDQRVPGKEPFSQEGWEKRLGEQLTGLQTTQLRKVTSTFFLYTTVECSSELFTEASGYVSSPEYPQPYPEDLRCNYSIRLQKGLSIILKFLEPFEIEEHQQVHCPYDQLKVLEISKLYFQPCCQTWMEIVGTPLFR